MRGNHLEAHQLEPDGVHRVILSESAISANRLYRLAPSDSNSADLTLADLDCSRFLLCFRSDLHLGFHFDLILTSDANSDRIYQIWSLTHAPKSGILDNVSDLPYTDSERNSHLLFFRPLSLCFKY